MSTHGAKQLLHDAWQTIGKRSETHGSPANTFEVAAKLWSAYLGVEVTPQQVSACMALLKVARASCGASNRDHWLDAAGYIGLAYQLEGEEHGKNAKD